MTFPFQPVDATIGIEQMEPLRSTPCVYVINGRACQNGIQYIYIGQTRKGLRERMRTHHNNYREFCKGRGDGCGAFDVMKYSQHQASVIGYFPNASNQLLTEKENEAIEYFISHPDYICLNRIRPDQKKKRKGRDTYGHNVVHNAAEEEAAVYGYRGKIECTICGATVTRHHLARHRRSKFCKKRVEYNKTQEKCVVTFD